LVRPSPLGNHTWGWRLGPTFHPPTWAGSDGHASSSEDQNPPVPVTPANPNPFHSFARPKTHESARRLRWWRRLRVCSTASVLPEEPFFTESDVDGRWIRPWLRSKAAPRGDLNIERRNTAVVRSFSWRPQLTRRRPDDRRRPYGAYFQEHEVSTTNVDPAPVAR
jgi:hypothetical protein